MEGREERRRGGDGGEIITEGRLLEVGTGERREGEVVKSDIHKEKYNTKPDVGAK